MSVIYYRFYKFAVFENKRKGKRNFAVGPLEVFVSKQSGPWLDLEQGRVGQPDFGEETRRRRGVGGGKGRGRRGAPVGGLGARGDGRTGLAGVKQGAAAGLCNGGGVPVAWGGGGGVGEDQ